MVSESRDFPTDPADCGFYRVTDPDNIDLPCSLCGGSWDDHVGFSMAMNGPTESPNIQDTLCKCGHTLEDHHRWWLRGGGAFADECEFYASNENGGAMPMHTKDERGNLADEPCTVYPCDRKHFWVDHCHKFEVPE